MPADRAPARGTLRVFDDAASLARAGAELLCARALAHPGAFRVALAGGETPKPLYRLLAEEQIRGRFPWGRVQWVFGDERFVPPTDAASNYAMARDALLSRIPVAPENIHPVPTLDVTPDEAAARYETTLKALYGATALEPDRPLLEVNLLGMGDDGHTASLIPGEPVLEERARWVAVVGHGRPEPRLTLTFPALESSRVTLFLITGEGKRAALDRVLSGDSMLPAGRLRPAGELFWFVDRAAAGDWA